MHKETLEDDFILMRIEELVRQMRAIFASVSPQARWIDAPDADWEELRGLTREIDALREHLSNQAVPRADAMLAKLDSWIVRSIATSSGTKSPWEARLKEEEVSRGDSDA